MELSIHDALFRVIILDISGLYAQIYDEGYYTSEAAEAQKQKFTDSRLWRVLVI